MKRMSRLQILKRQAHSMFLGCSNIICQSSHLKIFLNSIRAPACPAMKNKNLHLTQLSYVFPFTNDTRQKMSKASLQSVWNRNILFIRLLSAEEIFYCYISIQFQLNSTHLLKHKPH